MEDQASAVHDSRDESEGTFGCNVFRCMAIVVLNVQALAPAFIVIVGILTSGRRLGHLRILERVEILLDMYWLFVNRTGAEEGIWRNGLPQLSVTRRSERNMGTTYLFNLNSLPSCRG